MPAADRPRVLLLWPGGLFGGEANFGVPQILSLARAARRAGAIVEVVDLDLERALGRVDLRAIARRGWDLVGVSCYSSYEYLKVMEIGAILRAELPRAWLVTGGYHPSARPDDFTAPDSPFDFVVVGDGERPLARLVEDLAAGRRPEARVLGPDPFTPSDDDALDWSLLDRYRPVARSVASQAEIYLSRGCPFDCAFCMERAKRETSWRAPDPGRALEELHRLDRFLDLSTWTLFIADALFGMKRAWRRELLEGLARRPVRARKIWLLVRIDLVEREDLALMARANVAPGFGLESGDPGMLRLIRKAGSEEAHLDRMLAIAGWAHELRVPFGANVIVGHPGETEESLRTTASYLGRLFLDDPRGTMGFLSVDPFRLYPGSPIDLDRAGWEARTGMRAHRYPWWNDGDQGFLSEWIDPSATLDFRRAHRLRRELFGPIVRGIAQRFAYRGPARDYFMRAVDEQVELFGDRAALRTLGLHHLWQRLAGEPDRKTLADDRELADAARGARLGSLRAAGIGGGRGGGRRGRSRGTRERYGVPAGAPPSVIDATTRVGRALADVPRERFVRVEDIEGSADDAPLPLDDAGAATVSALHAYATAFAALELGEGDTLADLGGGSGYGAAVAAEIVGPAGHVTTVEIDPALAAEARANLADRPNVTVIEGSAHDVERWRGARKAYAGFAPRALPDAWVEALPEGGVLVAPVGEPGAQELWRVRRTAEGVTRERLGAVLYVGDRAGR